MKKLYLPLVLLLALSILLGACAPQTPVEVPVDVLKIDGRGLSALPGLLDLHIHTQGGWANGLIPGEAVRGSA